jgi:uncharacterized protein with HEPN domain
MAVDRDRAYVESILSAAQRASGHLLGKVREDLDRDPMLQDALVWVLATVGEAASKLSPAFRTTHSAIGWSAIARLRNELIHRYWNINLNRIWNAAKERLPTLAAKLQQIQWPKRSAAEVGREVTAIIGGRPPKRKRPAGRR